MPLWTPKTLEVLQSVASAPLLGSSFHASLYRESDDAVLVVLKQPNQTGLTSPYLTKKQCRFWLRDHEPESLAERLRRQLRNVAFTFVAHSSQDSMLPVRICNGPPQLTYIHGRRVSCDLLLDPPLSHEEWLNYGNKWSFHILVNYDVSVVFSEADIASLERRLAHMQSFVLTARRYQGDEMDILCDAQGCSVTYMDCEAQTKLFSVNADLTGNDEYVSRYVEEIDEETESARRFIIPPHEALSILGCYLRTGRVTGLRSDPEFSV